MIQKRRFFFFLAVAAGQVFFLVPRSAAAGNEDCFLCHGQPDSGAPFVDEKTFLYSIHGKNLCISCHRDVKEIPHASPLAPVVCANCHRVESEIYLNSDHGRAMLAGRAQAATCKDCHGHSHTLLNSRDLNSPVNRKNIVGTCARCHADAKRMTGTHLSEVNPLDSYNHTVHGQAIAAGRVGAAVCSDCHGTHDLHSAANPKSRVYRPNIPNTCERCHANVVLTYRASIHGKAAASGLKEAPVCTDCHGEHTILSPKDPQASTSVGAITKTCSNCHTSAKMALKLGLPLDRLQTYKDSYHGLAAERGNLRVANCASCHGFHDVLPSSDPQSSIHQANLPMTCGRCHPGAGQRLTTGYVHGLPAAKHWSVHVVKNFYLILIPLTLGFMFLHNLFDWWRKAWSGHGPSPLAHDNEIRLTGNERLQHFVLMVSFFVLAYTGLVSKFSDANWVGVVAPFGEHMRRNIHLGAALIFCLLSVYHVFYMTLTSRGRFLLKALQPTWKDVEFFMAQNLFNLGLRKNPPTPPNAFYHYAEKIEYWALVWGSVIMTTTGALQAFNNTTLKYFPLWFMDLAMQIHFYEAVLAALAILVWHIYGVMWDPQVYPLNWSWLTGRVKRQRKKDPPSR